MNKNRKLPIVQQSELGTMRRKNYGLIEAMRRKRDIM